MTDFIQAIVLAGGGSLPVSIAIKATLAMACGLIGARLARRSRAAVRHAVLAASFGVLVLLPAASIVAPPIRIPMPAVSQNGSWPPPPSGNMDAISSATLVDRRFDATPASSPSSQISWPVLLIAGWLAGVMLSLLPVAAGLWRIRALRRSALPWLNAQPAVDKLALDSGIRRHVDVRLHAALSGPMTCGVAHPAILMPPDARTWDPEDLNRAIIHELEHVRRRDHLSHCIARAVCSVYWFHPLVWMAWRQLTLEAERACDDAVLRCSEATAYADQLVGLAQRVSMAMKSPLVAMANRADLATRVRAVLDCGQSRGRVGVLPVAVFCAAGAAFVAAISPLRMVAAPQSSSSSRAEKFDAVSVKLISTQSGMNHSNESGDPGRLRMTGSLHRFIIRAYGITDQQLAGEPEWFKTNLYSLEAVTSAPARSDRKMVMLRDVLADRFQLKLRQDYRDLPVYVLEVAAGGPKFKELKAGEVPLAESKSPGIFAATFKSISDLVNSLNGVFGGILASDRPVVDHTNLTGNYDIHLRTQMEEQTTESGRRTWQFPDLFHDLQAKLGLKVVPKRVMMLYFSVEHAAPPTPN